MGIIDDEEAIRLKRERDEMLKGKFTIESFEQKYDREIKVLMEKQKKREHEKFEREREECTFSPLLRK